MRPATIQQRQSDSGVRRRWRGVGGVAMLAAVLLLPLRGMQLAHTQQPANDYITSPTAITLPNPPDIFTDELDTSAATPDGPVEGDWDGSNNVWYTFTLDANTAVRLTTDGSDYFARIDVFEHTAEGDYDFVTSSYDDSALIFAASAGTTYYIAVSAPDGPGGNLVFSALEAADDDSSAGDLYRAQTQAVATAATSLRVALAQMHVRSSLAENEQAIKDYIDRAGTATPKPQLLVVPEDALAFPDSTTKAAIDAAIVRIRAKADSSNMWVVMGYQYKGSDTGAKSSRGMVIDPDGDVVLSYRKGSDTPERFYIEGVPVNMFICSDRWRREATDLPAVVQGSSVLIDISNNFAMEWLPALPWHMHVPIAIRHNAFVLYANTSGSEQPSTFPIGHGHSAVIKPNGDIQASLQTQDNGLLTATLDLSLAHRTAANSRRSHPILDDFWSTGKTILEGGTDPVGAFEILTSTAQTLKVAAAQIGCSRTILNNVTKIKQRIATAAAAGAAVVAFPELAVTGYLDTDIKSASATALTKALNEIRAQANTSNIHVVIGMPWKEGGRTYNSAFAIDPAGVIQTRYDQMVVDRPNLFSRGSGFNKMWFKVRNVNAVITLGKGEAAWNELGQLTALKGALLHFNLIYDNKTSTNDTKKRKVIWYAMGFFNTLTISVNAASTAGVSNPSTASNGYSSIWDKMPGYRDVAPGSVSLYGYFTGNRIVEAATGDKIIYAQRAIGSKNTYRLSNAGSARFADFYEKGVHLVE